jgi:hypothetical protein
MKIHDKHQAVFKSLDPGLHHSPLIYQGDNTRILIFISNPTDILTFNII